jgi:hypothetical protein
VTIVTTNSGNNRVEQNLEILTDQVGRLTEGLYEFRADLREIKDILRQQTETTASLVRIVETLIRDKSQES